ncbi:MAG: metal ABC transporter solute-binding protein, Zn/Mn family [Arenicella sp.]
MRSNSIQVIFIGLFVISNLLFAVMPVEANSNDEQGVNIVTSIKPLALLVKEIMDDDDFVQEVLSKNQNHHLTSLKPSQRKMISQADVVFYIDESFETFLSKVKSSDAADSKYIALGDTPGLRLLSMRKSGQLPHVAHRNKSRKQASKHGHHGHSGVDWHIWLNPDNAMVMLMKIRDELTRIRPENEVVYQRNYEIFSQHLIVHASEKAKRMMEVLHSPFFVLHDGLQYFEEQYALHSSGIILRHDENSVSVRHLSELRKVRKDKGVNIVIKEEQYSDRAVKSLAGRQPFKVINVDSLAQGSLSHVEDYIEYTDELTNIIYQGLKSY